MMRQTKQKDIIMQAVQMHGKHPTADEIYQILKKDNPKLSLATVYRNLNQFADQGMLGRVIISGEPVHFDSNTEPHVHCVCHKCSHIIDIHDQDLYELVCAKKPTDEKLLGFQIDAVDLQYGGVCNDCRSKLFSGS